MNLPKSLTNGCQVVLTFTPPGTTLTYNGNLTLSYGTGLTTMAKQKDAANALIRHLHEQSAGPVIRKNGMEPAPTR